MTQLCTLFLDRVAVHFEVPGADEPVLPGLCWGEVEAFPSPAYWLYQSLALRTSGQIINNRIGRDLVEEVAACILGGHGIPAETGIAAFRRLRDRGLLTEVPTESAILAELEPPLLVNGRWIRYRFARQKAHYLSKSLRLLADDTPPISDGNNLRSWLTRLPGVGLKTASWIARNMLDADDVAILDIHIMRAGILGGFLDGQLSLTRDYLKLESQFLEFSRALGVRASELDAVIWMEMRNSESTVRELWRRAAIARISINSSSTSNVRGANANKPRRAH